MPVSQQGNTVPSLLLRTLRARQIPRPFRPLSTTLPRPVSQRTPGILLSTCPQLPGLHGAASATSLMPSPTWVRCPYVSGVCTPQSPCTLTSEASGLHLRREHSHTWNLFLVCACWPCWRHLHHETQQDREPTSTHSHLGDRPEHYVQ